VKKEGTTMQNVFFMDPWRERRRKAGLPASWHARELAAEIPCGCGCNESDFLENALTFDDEEIENGDALPDTGWLAVSVRH